MFQVKINVEYTKVDYIIVGLGIAGTWLSHELLAKGKNILVLNADIENTSSKKAAGLYNPITGQKMVKTWRADDFFITLEDAYHALEKQIGKKVIHPKAIYRPFTDFSNQNDWQGRQFEPEFSTYVDDIKMSSLGIENINDPLGGILIGKSGYVDLPALLSAYKKLLVSKGIYHEEVFDVSQMSVEKDEVRYNGWSATKIIFCEGTSLSSLWKDLPFRPVRGEIIDIDCNLPKDKIINQGVFIIPKQHFFTVGSTYDHQLLTFEPQNRGIEDIERRLGKIFAGEYRILDKRAGVRPATHDRKPYIGFHKKFRTLGIFNGFGTKGVSLTPYFAKHFVQALEDNIEIEKEVNVERVYQ